MTTTKPATRPAPPHFSSGPCAKRPGWTLQALDKAFLGRSHRAKDGKARLKLAIDKTKAILGLPAGHVCAIVPASDTGAYEMAMWTMLGARGVEALAWESFGPGWVTDIVKQLKLKDVKVTTAEYGHLPDLSKVDFSRDILFTANGTTSGVRVPNYDWIPADPRGADLRRRHLGGVRAGSRLVEDRCRNLLLAEGAGRRGRARHAGSFTARHCPPQILHAGLAAAEDLPPDQGGKFMKEVFEGETINTPSMLALEDYLDALKWAEGIGGLKALIARADANAEAIFDWTAKTPWIANLAVAPETRSNTSVCLRFTDPKITALGADAQAAFAKAVAGLLDKEGVANDIAYYRDAPPGLRIWCGSTVETADVKALLPWIEWAYAAESRN